MTLKVSHPPLRLVIVAPWMGEVCIVSNRSAIEWTETTWNPTTGCDQVSLGCDNRYPLSIAMRLQAIDQSNSS